MASDSSLFSLARNKLQSVIGGNVRDSDSLHRWVLLKNSIIRTPPSQPSRPVPTNGDATLKQRPSGSPTDLEQDAFMFPDPDTLLGTVDQKLAPGEEQWLDSVLEDLGDDDDDDLELEGLSRTVSPAREDGEPLSPFCSPMSSSDDLVHQPNYYYSSNIVSYPVPYPPHHPPLVPSWFQSDASASPTLSSSPPLDHDPFPYCDTDDLEDLPDAIEDTSDDESDAPSTPVTTSTSSLPTSPVSHERTQLLSEPRVYITQDDSFFAPFELDPLPFPSDQQTEAVRPYHRRICREC